MSKEPGQLAYETREQHYPPDERSKWRILHPIDKVEWAAVEAAIRADERAASDERDMAYREALEYVRDSGLLMGPTTLHDKARAKVREALANPSLAAPVSLSEPGQSETQGD
jgi:hypothetical protein